jgi:phenylacetate-coenzyme A ligase PaaK-like adenylate-forming protein
MAIPSPAARVTIAHHELRIFHFHSGRKHFAIVVIDAMDEIELLIEVTGGAAQSLVKKVAAKLRDTFSLRIPVKLAEPDSLPRHEFKARRWRLVPAGNDK